MKSFNNPNYRLIANGIVSLGCSCATSAFLGSVMKNAALNVSIGEKKYKKVLIVLGGSLVASCAGAKVGEYVDKILNDVWKLIDALQNHKITINVACDKPEEGATDGE